MPHIFCSFLGSCIESELGIHLTFIKGHFSIYAVDGRGEPSVNDGPCGAAQLP